MHGMLFAPLAEFLELQTGLDGLFILGGIIIDLLAIRALKLDKMILGHSLWNHEL